VEAIRASLSANEPCKEMQDAMIEIRKQMRDHFVAGNSPKNFWISQVFTEEENMEIAERVKDCEPSLKFTKFGDGDEDHERNVRQYVTDINNLDPAAPQSAIVDACNLYKNSLEAVFRRDIEFAEEGFNGPNGYLISTFGLEDTVRILTAVKCVNTGIFTEPVLLPLGEDVWAGLREAGAAIRDLEKGTDELRTACEEHKDSTVLVRDRQRHFDMNGSTDYQMLVNWLETGVGSIPEKCSEYVDKGPYRPSNNSGWIHGDQPSANDFQGCKDICESMGRSCAGFTLEFSPTESDYTCKTYIDGSGDECVQEDMSDECLTLINKGQDGGMFWKELI